jgi:hypothetical protein
VNLSHKYKALTCSMGTALMYLLLHMVLKTRPGREPEKGVVPVLVVDRGRTSGRTGDVINNN